MESDCALQVNIYVQKKRSNCFRHLYLSLFLSRSLLLYLCSTSPNNVTAFCKAANRVYGACFFQSVCSSLCHCLSVCLFPSPLPSKYVSSETANFRPGIKKKNRFQNESFDSANLPLSCRVIKLKLKLVCTKERRHQLQSRDFLHGFEITHFVWPLERISKLLKMYLFIYLFIAILQFHWINKLVDVILSYQHKYLNYQISH